MTGCCSVFQASFETKCWTLQFTDADRASLVNVASKAYRRVALYEPGEYEAVLSYNGTNTTAYWTVRDLSEERKSKNVILFIGDGMTTNMITAARLIAHKQINGKYQTTMAMDKFPVLGHQMTHSIDTFITDSANSATALNSGHKSTVNALNVYADSSPDSFDDPKVETWAEMFYRLYSGKVGIVSTAYIADATPAALTAHTRDRGEYGAVIDSYIHGIVNYTWTEWPGVDVLFGGGAEQFCPPELGGETYMDLNYYNVFEDAGYTLVNNATELEAAGNDDKILGIFSISNMAKWLDRNVYTDNLEGNEDAPNCEGGDATDQPGLKEMTLKAIDVLQARSEADDDSGWILMSEAASVDKQMHLLDYDRALGELLELDDTVKATIEHLKEMGELENTLIVVTADHGHGFDVFGNVRQDSSLRLLDHASKTCANVTPSALTGRHEVLQRAGGRPLQARGHRSIRALGREPVHQHRRPEVRRQQLPLELGSPVHARTGCRRQSRPPRELPGPQGRSEVAGHEHHGLRRGRLLRQP